MALNAGGRLEGAIFAVLDVAREESKSNANECWCLRNFDSELAISSSDCASPDSRASLQTVKRDSMGLGLARMVAVLSTFAWEIHIASCYTQNAASDSVVPVFEGTQAYVDALEITTIQANR